MFWPTRRLATLEASAHPWAEEWGLAAFSERDNETALSSSTHWSHERAGTGWRREKQGETRGAES